jgi:RNA polymerase sigma-70 factor (ECF subfamily)
MSKTVDEAAAVEALVERARHGDRQALAGLYDRYRGRVARFAAGRLGDAEKAEDVTSETFEAMLRSLRSYRQGPTSRRGCSRSPTAGVSDHFRRLGRRREVELDDGVPRAGTGPEDDLVAAGDRAEVARAFRSLRPDQREVLSLRVLGGLSAAQVGEVLGKSEGAVRVAQHRALASLRELMGVNAR